MSLGDQQRIFTLKVSLLIAYAYEQGYQLTFGDAWSKPKYTSHRRGSLHYSRLAIDLNLFKHNRYLSSTSSHEFLGLFWESIGGTWGGRFKDGNHYSMEYQGRK